ncbi:DoxX family protein [Microbacterium marmarense]|uniref:DoxX family protein n=1 Tax=Microbacterium marmarense TaxID=3122051 RepID=A0ABU8LV98_9MICO
MIIALWILNGILALAFLAAGAMKALRSKDALRASGGMEWVDGFSPAAIRLIGVAEVLGAVGLILPLLTGIAPILTPIAATALTILMIGATVTHARRHEKVVPTLVLTVLTIASAILGFVVVLG